MAAEKLPSNDTLGVRVIRQFNADGFWVQIRDKNGDWHFALFSPRMEFLLPDYNYVCEIIRLHGHGLDAVRGTSLEASETDGR